MEIRQASNCNSDDFDTEHLVSKNADFIKVTPFEFTLKTIGTSSSSLEDCNDHCYKLNQEADDDSDGSITPATAKRWKCFPILL